MKLRTWWRDKFGQLFTVKEKNCEYCGGRGFNYFDAGPASLELSCEDCDGSGVVEYDFYEEPHPHKHNDKVTL